MLWGTRTILRGRTFILVYWNKTASNRNSDLTILSADTLPPSFGRAVQRKLWE